MRFHAFAILALCIVRRAAYGVQAISAVAAVERIGHVLQRVVKGVHSINTAATTQQTPIVAFTAIAEVRKNAAISAKTLT